MGTSRVSSNVPTFVVVFHLIFSIVAIAFLSYKVYYLESELSLVRGKISTMGASKTIGSVQTPTPLTAAPSSKRSGRNRRAKKKESESSTADQLQVKCVQSLLKHMQVCNVFLCCLLCFLGNQVRNQIARITAWLFGKAPGYFPGKLYSFNYQQGNRKHCQTVTSLDLLLPRVHEHSA